MKNSAISERKNQSISRGVGMTTQIYADRAENSEIWDVEGRRYIDFAAGIAVVNTGHRHPKVIEAVKAMTAWRPVAWRAILTAFSTASAPVVANSVFFSNLPGSMLPLASKHSGAAFRHAAACLAAFSFAAQIPRPGVRCGSLGHVLGGSLSSQMGYACGS